jgi:hypothetical protein
VTYYLLIFGELHRDRLAAALAALLALPEDAVDVGDEDDLDRNWSAPVSCTVSPRAGDFHWHLDIYLTDAVTQRPADSVLAARLAQQLRTVVAYPGTEAQPSAYWIVGPDGRRTRARITDIGWEEGPVYRIEAVERPLAALPDLPVAPIPEVIREHRLPTPITDQLQAQLEPWSTSEVPGAADAVWRARTRLGAWEGLVARMATGWPPDGWYPATYYQEDLEYRDELARVGHALPEPARALFASALEEVDRQFVALTEDDGGAALATELGDTAAVPADPDRWWWRRIPRPVPWLNQPARTGS